MPLPVWAGAGSNQDAAVGPELDGTVFRPRHAGRPVHEHGHADAEEPAVAAGASLGLLGAQALVAGVVEGQGPGLAHNRRCRR